MLGENIEEKASFYNYFGGLMFFWYLSFPLFVTIAAFVAPWSKVKVIYSLTTVTNCIGVQCLAALFWPRWISVNFKVDAPDLMTANTPYDRI